MARVRIDVDSHTAGDVAVEVSSPGTILDPMIVEALDRAVERVRAAYGIPASEPEPEDDLEVLSGLSVNDLDDWHDEWRRSTTNLTLPEFYAKRLTHHGIFVGGAL